MYVMDIYHILMTVLAFISIEEIYIDYKGDKYDILPDKTLEALAEFMDREYDNFS